MSFSALVNIDDMAAAAIQNDATELTSSDSDWIGDFGEIATDLVASACYLLTGFDYRFGLKPIRLSQRQANLLYDLR